VFESASVRRVPEGDLFTVTCDIMGPGTMLWVLRNGPAGRVDAMRRAGRFIGSG